MPLSLNIPFQKGSTIEGKRLLLLEQAFASLGANSFLYYFPFFSGEGFYVQRCTQKIIKYFLLEKDARKTCRCAHTPLRRSQSKS